MSEIILSFKETDSKIINEEHTVSVINGTITLNLNPNSIVLLERIR